MGKTRTTKQVLFLVLVTLLAIAYLVVCPILGYIDYLYEVDKCTNLKTSTYEFTHDIQVNVEYTQHCYWINNHILVIPIHIMFAYLLGGLILLLPGFILFIVYHEKYDDWGERDAEFY